MGYNYFHIGIHYSSDGLAIVRVYFPQGYCLPDLQLGYLYDFPLHNQRHALAEPNENVFVICPTEAIRPVDNEEMEGVFYDDE